MSFKNLLGYYGSGVMFYTIEDNKIFVLLGKRKNRPCKKKYSLIGGGYNKYKDSNLLDTAVRESYEETHIIVEKEKLKKIWSFNFLFHFSTYCYRLNKKENILDYDDEFDLIQWFEIDKIPKNRCYFINKYCKRIKKLSL